jgi:hypothetical protein
MAYYPKNKIKTNLYTGGGEFVTLVSNINYVGYYHKLYNGKSFTGKTPNDPNPIELINIQGSPDAVYNDSVVSTNTINYSPLLPTDKDYKVGEFTRYFTVKRNEPIFTEISKKEYDRYKNKDASVYWRLYKPISLFWRLTGEINQVAKTNKNVTELVEQRDQAFGLGFYLKEDWIQYYKEKP